MMIKPTNIPDPKILARINNPEALKSTFDSWDKEKLVQYALSLTKTISGAPSPNKEISTSELAAHPLIQGMALVEEIGQNLSSTLDLDEVLARLLRLANEALGVEDASIFLIEEPSGDLISQISLGAISGGRRFRVPKGRGIAGEVAHAVEHDGVVHEDAPRLDLLVEQHLEASPRLGTGCVAGRRSGWTFMATC